MNNLKSFREKAGLTQTDLGHAIGVSARYVAFLERGDRCPSLKVAVDISKVLGKSIEDIFLLKRCTKRTVHIKRGYYEKRYRK